MKLFYFAWVKSKIGIPEEELTLPGTVTTVGALLDWLATRGANYADALAERNVIKVAVNEEYAAPGDPVGDGDEIAIFPPVTGG